MRWRSKLGVTLAAAGALAACGRSHHSVSGGVAGRSVAGSSNGSGGSPANEGGAPDTGATGGNAASGSPQGGNGARAGNTSSPGGSSGTGNAGSSSAGTGGAGMGSSAGAGASAGAPGAPDRDDHTPPAVVPDCVHSQSPAEELEPPTEVRVGDTWLRSSERDCAWTTGEPVPLPLEPDDPGELLFQFDLNGDHIDDLIFGDHATGASTASGRAMLVLESHLDEGELTYERSSCGSPWDLSYRSFYARDLDRDGQLDFVIGRINGISALLNRPGVRPEVLHYDWPPGTTLDPWASILDVAVGDFDADGRDDIAVGYDRAAGTSLTMVELGVILFRDRSAQGTYGEPEVLTQVAFNLSSSSTDFGTLPAGLLATLGNPAGTNALVSLYMNTGHAAGLRYENGESTNFQVPNLSFSQPNFARGAAFGGEKALWIGAGDAVDIVRASPPYELLASIPTAYTHRSDHELGGGTRSRSFFLLDIDGDGDEDLVESGSDDSSDSQELSIHDRLGESHFAAPTLAQRPTRGSSTVESPFVRAGVMPGRLFVSVDGSPEGAALVPLVCNGE